MHVCYPSLSYPLNDEPTSGVGAQVRLLAQALTAAGHEISVVDLASDPAVSDDDGVTVHRVRAPRLHCFVRKLPFIGKAVALPVRELEYSLAVWRAVREINKSRRIDVIEGTETGMLWLALGRQIPVIIRLHGEQYTFQKFTPGVKLTLAVRLTRALQRAALRRAKLLISPSYAHAREIQGELHNSHPPIVVVPNNVSLNGATRNGVPRSSNTVVYAGRIERRKGITTFLRAAAQTRQALPDARFVIAGDFHSSLPETEFRDVLQSCDLGACVDVLGPIGKNVLAELYKRSTVAVLPSHYETFGLAALEPMAFGTPVIAASSSALSEVVVPELNGKLVPAGDETALAAAMIEVLRNSDARAAMGQAAIEHAAKYDVRNVVNATEHLYRWTSQSWTAAKAHVFFSPHADDVVLSCGGAIQSLITHGKNVQVITVFAGDSAEKSSGFARHLHRKWRTAESVARQRRQEDLEALRILGVNHTAYWNYLEAPDRLALDGASLYASYDEINGTLSAKDERLIGEISERIIWENTWPDGSIFYFPLALGNHVDHQVLAAVGRRLAASGRHVRFYEDYPYAENYRDVSRVLNWLPQVVVVPVARKLRALAAYKTQLYGLGGALGKARKRLRQFSYRFGSSSAERFWELSIAGVQGLATSDLQPLTYRPQQKRFRDFGKFMQTFRWHDLDEVLPVGDGPCADIGCGSGRHKELIESRGYKWVGIDARGVAGMRGAAEALPLAAESQAAATAWQVLEYVSNPAMVFAEVARVLEPGGVFCGSVSFLEPLHGQTYFNLSPLIVKRLLVESGFGDITIKPGLNGFALTLWTFLRRMPVPGADRLAIVLAFLLLVPFTALLFVGSWLALRLRIGDGHFMKWISQTAPLEFAGHVMFVARKRASRQQCT
jgi:glycosyltransferase involved in cell wall biosynthesis/LmbE family N-acetylglucosaminyl deacetylase